MKMEWKYTKENPLRVATLCSGYESQCMALRNLGIPFDLVLWAEFDPESKKPLNEQPAVIAHNAVFPEYADRNWGDMTKIDWEKAPDFDLLFYSTPCQSISNAGLQHGFVEGSGTRSSIIWNVRDAIKVKRPKYAILENVKAMISDKFVGMFNLWQSELLKFGYTNFPQVLNAKDYGIPQNRERIFLVSVLGDSWFNFPQPVELKLRLKDMLEESVDEKYYIDDLKVAEFVGQLEKDKLGMICSD